MKEDANLIDLAEDSETEINEAMSGEKKLEEEDEEQPTDWENPEDIRNERQTDTENGIAENGGRKIPIISKGINKRGRTKDASKKQDKSKGKISGLGRLIRD